MVSDKARVLIVDDNRITIKAIAEALKHQCKIMAATNYEQAERAIHSDWPPDLILLDIMMPGVDGFEICRRIKSDPESRDIPVIFITAMDDEADEAKGLSMGAVDYIAKPIVPAIVRARVRTQIELRRHMEALRVAYATIQEQKERMEQELEVGHRLQISLQPPLPSGEEFEVAACMRPAREVSGDFYDAFYVDLHHVCFCIGDVSGKGVPAALFMSMSRTLVRSKADKILSTASIVTEVNRALALSNDACMFVTMVVAMLDTRTGELTYTNAGHTAPLVLNQSGQVEKLSGRHGMAVGIEDVCYSEDTVKLDTTKAVVFYTDGVTEARDPEGHLFSEQRLVEWLARQSGQPPQQVIDSLTSEVENFESGAPHADDVTLLSLRYHGEAVAATQSCSELALGGVNLSTERASQLVSDFVGQLDLPKDLRNVVYLVLEEMITNVIRYGYPGEVSEPDIGVRVENSGPAVVVHISDDGVAFNPLEAELPDTSVSLDQREAGGLGIYLCRQLVDEMYYERRNLRNNLRLTKYVEGESCVWIADGVEVASGAG